jgi:hypothetical protein
MNNLPDVPPPLPVQAAPSPARALRRLFLTLFLRGRTSRGLKRETAPKSIGSKLGLTLVIYALVGGFMSMALIHRPVFVSALYLHSMTLVFLGMFVAASAGEILFNKDEADILMHRPVTPRAMLWAKIAVLVQVSLWLAGAFNLAGLFTGALSAHPVWLFPIIHALSTGCEALFCTGCIVLVYQLCLRWFGREKMEGMMTGAQIVVAVGAVLLGQLGPQLIGRHGLNFDAVSVWWINFLPPAWFACLDDAVAGTGRAGSWMMGALGLAVTGIVLWLAFGKLARDYETGLQALNEASSAPRRGAGRRRLIDKLVKLPPLSWWLRDSVARSSFLLTAAYLSRDRDVKLRVYPGIAPMLVMPFIFLLQPQSSARAGAGAPDFMSGFGIAFSGAYLGLIPYMALIMIRYSQQWQAGDLFRVAPISGPASLCHGARRAVLLFLALPMLVIFGVIVYFVARDSAHLALFIPGIIALPIYAMIPCLGGKAVPFSLPTEESKSTTRGLSMMGVMFISCLLAFASTLSWAYGFFRWLILGETILVIGIYFALRATVAKASWPRME